MIQLLWSSSSGHGALPSLEPQYFSPLHSGSQLISSSQCALTSTAQACFSSLSTTTSSTDMHDLTGLIAWRIYNTGRFRPSAGNMMPIIVVLIESGALYTSSVIAMLCSYLSGSNGQYPALDLITPLVVSFRSPAISLYPYSLPNPALLRRVLYSASSSYRFGTTSACRPRPRRHPIIVQARIVPNGGNIATLEHLYTHSTRLPLRSRHIGSKLDLVWSSRSRQRKKTSRRGLIRYNLYRTYGLFLGCND